MKKFTLVCIASLTILVLAWCDKTRLMTNDEIIAEKGKCLSGGMSYELFYAIDWWRMIEVVVAVSCAKPSD